MQTFLQSAARELIRRARSDIRMSWIDWDPTNNMRVDLDHISIAWGRDYADVAPVQGVFIGGGETTLNVAVDVVLANEQEANRSKPNE